MHLKANIDLFSVNSGRQNKPTSVYDKSAFFFSWLNSWVDHIVCIAGPMEKIATHV